MAHPTVPAGVLRDDSPILEIEDLVVQFKTDAGWVTAVDGLSYALRRGETLGVVGESGSGKSVTNLAVMRLLPTPPARVKSGRVRLKGEELFTKSEAEMRKLRGNTIAMIFQDPMTSLNPYMRIGKQLTEVVRLHQKRSAAEAHTLALEMLDRVGIPDARRRIDSYPHEFSGGMRQRVMIAMMLLNRPEILIADEPTTALDVTIQAQILDLLRDLQKELGMADRVIVMYSGRIMEEAPARALYADPSHPYTIGLLASIPRADQDVERLYSIPGRPPDLDNRPKGCPFAPRCTFVKDLCHRELPELVDVGRDHRARCHFVAEVRAQRPTRGVA